MAQVQKPFESDIPECVCGAKPTISLNRNPYEPTGCFVCEITCPECGLKVGPYGISNKDPWFVIEKWKEAVNEAAIEQTNLQAMKENGMLDDEEEPLVELKKVETKPENKPYLIRIEESFKREVIVWASDGWAAIARAEELCNNGTIDMSRNCFDGRNVSTTGIAGDKAMKTLCDYA